MSIAQIMCYNELNISIYNRLNPTLTIVNKLIVQVYNLACTQSKIGLRSVLLS